MVVTENIKITKELKQKLDNLKIISAEPYNDVIERIINKKVKHEN